MIYFPTHAASSFVLVRTRLESGQSHRKNRGSLKRPGETRRLKGNHSRKHQPSFTLSEGTGKRFAHAARWFASRPPSVPSISNRLKR
jgi:hypothetical protein